MSCFSSVVLNLWDTAGQDRFRKFNEEYLPKADAVILLYDVRDKHSLKETHPFVEDIKRFCDDSVIKFLGMLKRCIRKSLCVT